jgi:hypothetical protein
MTTNKKWLAVGSLVVVLALVIYFIEGRTGGDKYPTEEELKQSYNQTKNPGFTIGEFVRWDGDRMEFKNGQNIFYARTSSVTKLMRRSTATGQPQVTEVNKADFTPSQKILVYYIDPPENNVYEAYKIELAQ